MSQHRYLLILLAAYLIVGSLYAIFTPVWQAPDEPAHYNYIRQLASGQLPVMEEGDYDQEYQSLVISSQFDERYSVDSFEYQDYQPPLYYLLLTPIYWLFDAAVTPLRLASVIVSAGVIALAYFITLAVFPGKRWIALTAAAFAAFLPQHTAMMASINNDSLSELIIALLALLMITLLRSGRDARWEDQRNRLFLSGIILGLGFVTKVSAYIMAPLIGLTVLWLYWRRWNLLWQSLLVIFVPALVIGSVWWARNIVVYGDWDLLGTATHNEIVVGQPRTIDWIEEKGAVGMLRAFIQTTFQSFWGQFGWMGVVMPSWVYQILLLFTLLTSGGLLWAAARYWRKGGEAAVGDLQDGDAWKGQALFLLGTFILSVMVYLTYNLTFVQHQGRYLFSALIPISVGVAYSWVVLTQPVTERWPTAVFLLPLGLSLSLIALDLLALFRFIVPSLT